MGNRSSKPKVKKIVVSQGPKGTWQDRMDTDFDVFVRTLASEQKGSVNAFGKYLIPPNYSGMNFCFAAVDVLKRMIEKNYGVKATRVAYRSKQSSNSSNYWDHMALKLPETEGSLIIDPTWKQFWLVSDISEIVDKSKRDEPNIFVGSEDDWKELVFGKKGSDIRETDPESLGN